MARKLCSKGHELTKDNTYADSRCAICQRERSRTYRQKMDDPRVASAEKTALVASALYDFFRKLREDKESA